jgi:ribonuclease HI
MTGNFRKKANLDWWKKLDEAAGKHNISWQWTKGHAGHEVQEIADKMARRAAEAGKIDERVLDEAVAEIGVKEL